MYTLYFHFFFSILNNMQFTEAVSSKLIVGVFKSSTVKSYRHLQTHFQQTLCIITYYHNADRCIFDARHQR